MRSVSFAKNNFLTLTYKFSYSYPRENTYFVSFKAFDGQLAKPNNGPLANINIHLQNDVLCLGPYKLHMELTGRV